MKVRTLWANDSNLMDDPIYFGPGVNIIRGENGCGKTKVAELVSLLGHLSIIRSFVRTPKHRGACFAKLEVVLAEQDVLAIAALRAFLGDKRKAGSGETVSFLLRDQVVNLSSENAALVREVMAGLKAFKGDVQVGESIFVEFQRLSVRTDGTRGHRVDLKEILAQDALLSQHLEFCAYNDRLGDCAALMQALISWNRPRQTGTYTEEGEEKPVWSLTPRFILASEGFDPVSRAEEIVSQKRMAQAEALERGEPQQQKPSVDEETVVFPLPGVVGYVNTDMYDFGAGIDIRESPKELREKMSETLVDRLQIVGNLGNSLTAPLKPVVKSMSNSHFDLNRKKEVSDCWAHVFGKSHPMRTGSARTDGLGEIHWCSDDGVAEFISSGENQAFFLLAYLQNLHPPGSILIIDEPEIHLSIKAASALMKEILRICCERKTQVIIITHLPHLYRKHVRANFDWDSFDDDRQNYRLLYLQRAGERIEILDGLRALEQASRDSHLDVLELVENLQVLDDHPGTKIRNAWRFWENIRPLG